MVASYDFDIHWLIPHDVEADPALGRLLDDIGVNGEARGTTRGKSIALFRDPQVVAMIERADPVLRAYLKASGFGFNTGRSGAPAGHFPAEDTTARAEVIARLDTQLGRFDFDGADLGGFDLGAFRKAIAGARPLDAAPLPASDAGSDRAGHPACAPRSALDTQPEPRFAKLSGRNRILPLMVLSLAATLGVYWLVQQSEAVPVALSETCPDCDTADRF